MIPEYRAQYNAEFTGEKYSRLKAILKEKIGFEPGFRLSESPVFLPKYFKDKLNAACHSIIEQIKAMPRPELEKALPKKYNIPGDSSHPHFLIIDFGICKNTNGEAEPQLIELQAFPSLYAFQKEFEQSVTEVYPFLNPLKNPMPKEDYVSHLKDLILGEENPENVVLLEIFPEKQKTRVDFDITEKYLGINTVCITKIKKEVNGLYYNNDGKITKINRIYNRVIFDELEKIPDLKLDFDFQDELDVKWITHPNWFFMISKYLLPKLQHEFIPKSYFLNDFPDTENLEDFILKPLFSFAGSGVNLHPTREILEQIENRDNFILQRKVGYEPWFLDVNGDYSKAEIRMMYIWKEGEAMPILMENIVRMTKEEMANVDFNKKNAIWTGSSLGFFG